MIFLYVDDIFLDKPYNFLPNIILIICGFMILFCSSLNWTKPILMLNLDNLTNWNWNFCSYSLFWHGDFYCLFDLLPIWEIRENVDKWHIICLSIWSKIDAMKKNVSLKFIYVLRCLHFHSTLFWINT